MMCEIVREMVKKQALGCGFETRLQADGSEDFDANVYAFAHGVLFDVGRKLCNAFAQTGLGGENACSHELMETKGHFTVLALLCHVIGDMETHHEVKDIADLMAFRAVQKCLIEEAMRKRGAA